MLNVQGGITTWELGPGESASRYAWPTKQSTLDLIPCLTYSLCYGISCLTNTTAQCELKATVDMIIGCGVCLVWAWGWGAESCRPKAKCVWYASLPHMFLIMKNT